MRAGRQTTLRNSATLSGIGVHSGKPATITLYPAEPNTGIVFVRLGPDGTPQKELRADANSVYATEFATVLGDRDGPVCATAVTFPSRMSGLAVVIPSNA